MSGLDLVSVQELISAYVRAQFPNYEVYEDELLDNIAAQKVDNKNKPYIVLRWGAMRRSNANANFGGVRFDEYNSSVDVAVVAPTGVQARKALNVIMDKLIGWKPTGGSALTPFGGAGVYVVKYSFGKPELYGATARLSFALNGEDPGAPIQP
jgi:hypothetical protein